MWSRRATLKTIFGALTGLVVLPPVKASARPAKPLMCFAVAGGFYHGLGAALKTMKKGDALILRPEPANPYDTDAIEVLNREWRKLGYVPRSGTGLLHAALAEGRELQAEVVGFVGSEEPEDDLVFTGYIPGDPIIRLSALG